MADLKRPAFDADHRTSLLGWFQLQREIVVLKTDGLAEADVHRVVIPTSPLMTVGGLLSHLRWCEHLWFQVAYSRVAESENPMFEDDPDDNEFIVGQGKPLDQLVAEYEEECRRSDAVIAAAGLDDRGAGTTFPAAGATLGWMIHHMFEETARHAGHLDLIRELLDGEKSYF